MNKFIFLAVDALIISAVAGGTNLNFKVFNETNGLPAEIVFGAAQDKYGFMWFATADGVARFDGYEFKVFHNYPDSKSSVSASSINGIYCSPDGDLFAATEKGINIYDYKTESFSLVRCCDDFNAELSNMRVRCAYEHNGILWIGTLDGLFRYDRNKEYVNHFKLVPDTRDKWQNEIRTINMDKDGFLWLGTFDGVYRFNPVDNSFTKYSARIENENDQYNNLINCIFFTEDYPDYVFIGGSNGLVVMDYYNPGEIVKCFTRRDGLTSDEVRGIVQYDEDRLMVATAIGLTMYNVRTGEMSRHYSSRTDQTSIPDNSLRSIFKDKQNIIWVCSDRGVAMLDTNQKDVGYVPLSSFGITEQTIIYDILADEGKMWLSSNEGVFLLQNGERTMSIRRYGKKEGLSHQISKCLFKDSRGILWVGTNDGLNYYDAASDRFVRVVSPSDKFIIKYVYDIKEDSRHNIVTNISSGLCFVTPVLTSGGKVGGFEFSSISIADIAGSEYCDIGYINVDQSGMIWFSGSNYGLFSLNQVTGAVLHYTAEPGNPNSLSSNKIPSIFVSSDGTVWLGTSNGLCKFDRVKGDFIRLSIPEIIGAVKSIHEDSLGRLWIATSNKIITIDPSSPDDKFTLDLYQSLKVSGLTYNSDCDDSEGNLYWGCHDGFIRVNPDSIFRKESTGDLYLTAFTLFNKRITPENQMDGIMKASMILSEGLVLKSDENSFSLQFAMLDYSSSNNCSYKYKLEGYDDVWRYNSPGFNEASYSRIPPGKYRFRVQACNSDSVWSDNEASVNITVRRPVWLSTGLLCLYALIICLILYLVARFIKDRIRLSAELSVQIMEREKMEELNHNKMMFFTNVSHEFKTPLSLITGPVDCLMEELTDEKQKSHLRIIKQNSDRLKYLIEEIMDIRRLDNSKLQLYIENGDFILFARKIFDSFRYVAQKRHINYEMVSDSNGILIGFDSVKMEKVLYNLLSNAFKFTQDEGRISLAISRVEEGERDLLSVKVNDNGAPIPEDELKHIFERFYQGSPAPYAPVSGTGIGLAMTKEYVELHNGTISVTSNEVDGTTFYFSIPFVLKESTGETEIADEPISSRKKIVLIEDNLDMQSFIRMNLNQEYNVYAADNGADGIKAVRDSGPDVIVTDIMLPGMDGYEVCRICKSDMVLSDIPIIILSAKNDEDSRTEGYESGADAYLYKPFNMRTLKSRIRSLIKQREALQEKFRREFLFASGTEAPGNEEDRFISNIVRIIEDNMEEPDFGIEQLCDKTRYSYQQIYRKVRALTGEPISEFIRTVRLKRAASMLASNDSEIRISDVMYKVGFSTHSYFTKCFKEKYGVSPKEFIEAHRKTPISSK